MQYQALNKNLNEHLLKQGVKLDGIYHCPHHPKGSVPELAVDCDCRKPKPGLLLQAAHELGLSLPNSLLIGDKRSDIEAARAAGVHRAYSVESDNAESMTKADGSDGHFSSLFDCATYISMTRLRQTA
jgi:D-glycero-D-manno-heptose 1,7-bisphosphate phosphatase